MGRTNSGGENKDQPILSECVALKRKTLPFVLGGRYRLPLKLPKLNSPPLSRRRGGAATQKYQPSGGEKSWMDPAFGKHFSGIRPYLDCIQRHDSPLFYVSPFPTRSYWRRLVAAMSRCVVRSAVWEVQLLISQSRSRPEGRL